MVDIEEYSDVVVGGLFALTVAVNAGRASVELFGVDLADVLTTVGPATLDIASLLSIGAVVVAWVLGRPDFDRMDSGVSAAVLLTLGLVVLGMIEPGWAGSNDVLGILAVGVSAAGYWGLVNGG